MNALRRAKARSCRQVTVAASTNKGPATKPKKGGGVAAHEEANRKLTAAIRERSAKVENALQALGRVAREEAGELKNFIDTVHAAATGKPRPTPSSSANYVVVDDSDDETDVADYPNSK